MIKLFTLENISAFSSDAVYKICLSLDDYGLLEENMQGFETYDAMLTAANFTVMDGDHAIVAVEPNDFLSVKRSLIEKLQLDTAASPEITERIAQSGKDAFGGDADEHGLIARGSTPLLTEDGLFSGFTLQIGEGRVTLLPLDFSRIDPTLDALIQNMIAEPDEPTIAVTEEPAPTVDFATPARRVADALNNIGRRLALADGEAVSWLADLPSTVEGFSTCVGFVPVSDVAYDMQGNPVEETPFTAIQRKAKEARVIDGADYGAAISDIYSDERVDSPSFFALIAISDSTGTKAKKITTTSQDDLRLMLPHCIMVLFDTICQKTGTSNPEEETLAMPPVQTKPEEQKVSKGMIAFAAVVLLAAVLVLVFLMKDTLKKPEANTTPISDSGSSLTQPTQPTQSTLPTEPTTVQPYGNYLAPAEPPATDVSASPTAAPSPSSAGTFTFYVFGYGHGVGLSQNGANYYASLGWNYAQILANYYYGTTLVFHDTYPATINYAGTDYNTRDYLASALETEMGSSFQREALKAQAVALYTFAKYNNFKLNADANAYGKAPSQLCLSVVDDVMANGLYIAYNGTTALTPFHSISAGKTTSYTNAWSGTADLPYLTGGRPSYGDQSVPNYQTTFTISSADFKALASQKLSVELTGDPATWITILSHDQAIDADTGYVSRISVGGKEISGNQFRSTVMEGKIRSHCFRLVYTPTA